jgi:hypothetical protein
VAAIKAILEAAKTELNLIEQICLKDTDIGKNEEVIRAKENLCCLMAPPMSVPKRSDDAPSESGGITQEQLDAAQEETAKAKRAQAAAEARVSDAAGDPEAIANAEAAAKAEAEVKAATEAATTLLNTKAAILKAFQDIQLQLTNTPTEQSDAIKRIIDELAKTITIVADYSTKYTDTQKNTVSETVANTNPEWQTVIQDDGTVYYFKEPPIGSRWLPDDTIAAAEVTKDPVLAGAETLAEGIVVHKNRYPNGRPANAGIWCIWSIQRSCHSHRHHVLRTR